jgi:hypothetical protein
LRESIGAVFDAIGGAKDEEGRSSQQIVKGTRGWFSIADVTNSIVMQKHSTSN